MIFALVCVAMALGMALGWALRAAWAAHVAPRPDVGTFWLYEGGPVQVLGQSATWGVEFVWFINFRGDRLNTPRDHFVQHARLTTRAAFDNCAVMYQEERALG